MALRERTVQGYVVDGDGAAVSNARVKFKPTTPIGYTSTHVVVDREFEALTNSLGAFSKTLWCDEDSLVAINYLVTFPIANGGQADASHVASFSLAYGDGSAIDIGTLIATGLPAPTPTELLYAAIDGRIAAANKIYSPDKPTGTELFRDDFTGGALGAGWVELNAESPNQYTVDKSLLQVANTHGNPEMSGKMRNLPAGECTIFARLWHIPPPTDFSTQFMFGLLLSETAVIAMPAQDINTNLYFGGVSAMNTLCAGLSIIDTDFTFREEMSSFGGGNFLHPTYFRIHLNAAHTNADLQCSFDGLIWTDLGTAGAAFAFLSFGIGLLNNQIDIVHGCCDWIAVHAGEVWIPGG